MAGKRANHRKKTPKSKILKYITDALYTGEHSHMLYFVNKEENIFEIKFVDKKSSHWKEKDISLFKALDDLLGRFKTEPNYEVQCKVRARGNLSSLCKRGFLEYRGILKDKATKKRRYRILKRVEGSISPKTMKNVSAFTTSGPLLLKVVYTANSSLQQSVGIPCAYIYKAESEMQKSESQSSEIKKNYSLGCSQTAWASSSSESEILTSLVPDDTRQEFNYSLGCSETAWTNSPSGSRILTSIVPEGTRETFEHLLRCPQTSWPISLSGSEFPQRNADVEQFLTSPVLEDNRETFNYSLECPQTALASSLSGSEILTSLVPDDTRQEFNYSLGCSQTAWTSSRSGSELPELNAGGEQLLTSPVPDDIREAVNYSLGCFERSWSSSSESEILTSLAPDDTRQEFNIPSLPNLEDFGELEIPRLWELLE